MSSIASLGDLRGKRVLVRSDLNVPLDHDKEGAPEITVNVIADFSTGYHSRNGGGDSIRTDGDLPVVDVRAVRVQPVEAPRSAGEVSA